MAEERITHLERDFSASMTQIARSLNDIEGVQYEQGAIQKEHSRDLLDIKKRLDRIEGSLAGAATKADLAALETRVVDSFTRLLSILDERLPKSEE